MQGGYDRGNEAPSGAVERLTVVLGPNEWKSYMTSNLYASYFSQRAKCYTAKRMIETAADSGVYGYYIYADGSRFPTSGVMTSTGLLARVGAPTNWFDVTPYFNLAAHSNGWRFFPSILSNMVCVSDNYPASAITVTNGHTYSSHSDAYWPTITEAYNDAADAWYTDTASSDLPASYADISMNAGLQHYATLVRRVGDIILENDNSPITNLDAAATAYAWVAPGLYGHSGTNVYSAQGDNVISSGPGWSELPTWYHAFGVALTPPLSMTLTGNSAPPIDYSSATNAITGWSIQDVSFSETYWMRAIYRYNAPGLTNGFRWFK